MINDVLLSICQDFIQLREVSEILLTDSFFERSSWSTTSKAFLISKTIAPTSLPLSILLTICLRDLIELCCRNGVFGNQTVICAKDHISLGSQINVW